VGLRLAANLAHAGGRGRAGLLAACAAVSTALLLVAWTLLLLPASPDEQLFNLVAEPGLRGGTTLATVLMVLPLLLLIHQVIRLGTSARERRLAALRLAGATPGEVQVLGATEVGVPVLAGAVAGLGVYAFMRTTLGGSPAQGAIWDDYRTMVADPSSLALVPTSVTPTWWQFLAVIALVTLAGVGAGWAAGRHVVVSPLGLTRRVGRRSPKPWGLLLLAVGALAGLSGIVFHYEILVYLDIAVILVSVPGTASWFANRVGRWVQARTADPATLLAARRLVHDPRPAGRAGAAIGAVGIVIGFASVLIFDYFLSSDTDHSDPFFIVSFSLLGAVVALAFAAGAFTLLVQAVESLMGRRRTLAALIAAGTPLSVLRRAQFQEAWLATAPLAASGTLLGVMVAGAGVETLFVGMVAISLVLGLTRLSVAFMTHLVGPWLMHACSTENLRTP